MCERCRRMQAETIPALIASMRESDDETIVLVGKLLGAAHSTTEWNADSQAAAVDEIMLDTHASSRTDAIGLASWLIPRLTMMKNRIINEAAAQKDPCALSVQWDGERQAFVVRGANENGQAFEIAEPMRPGETIPAAFTRIANYYLALTPHNRHEL